MLYSSSIGGLSSATSTERRKLDTERREGDSSASVLRSLRSKRSSTHKIPSCPQQPAGSSPHPIPLLRKPAMYPHRQVSSYPLRRSSQSNPTRLLRDHHWAGLRPTRLRWLGGGSFGFVCRLTDSRLGQREEGKKEREKRDEPLQIRTE